MQKETQTYGSDRQQCILDKQFAIGSTADSQLVIDGISCCKDYVFWKEQEFRRFFLIYIDSDYLLRKRRFENREKTCVSYQKTMSDYPDSRLNKLRHKADFLVNNNGSIDQLFHIIDEIILKIRNT